MEEIGQQLGQSSLVERLRSIDKDAWAEIANSNGLIYHMKIGMLAHQAADELELYVKKESAEGYKLAEKQKYAVG